MQPIKTPRIKTRWINRRPGRSTELALLCLPFLLLLMAYLIGSALRLEANPNDKLLPSPAQLWAAIGRMALMADPRTGDWLLWSDTAASLARLAAGLGIATALALLLGMVIGMLPYLRATLGAFVAFLSMVPPLALLPILFIVLGLGETAKIALIVIGVTPIMIRDLALKVQEIPREMIVKAETLAASTWLLAIRVVLPRLLTCLRLQLGPAFLFLIAAEAISADSGLGYRIFLVRRYLAMDVIFPYVAWITLLAVLADLGLDTLRRRLFPWSELEHGR